MPWNGSGVFNRVYSWQADAAAGIDISALRTDTDTNDITANGLGNCITRDGQGSASALQPMNGFRHTGAGAAVGDSDYVILSQMTSTLTTTLAAYVTSASLTTTLTGYPTIAHLEDGSLPLNGSSISTSGTLLANGLASLSGGASILNGATVFGGATVNGAFTANNAATVGGVLTANSTASITGLLTALGGASVVGGGLSVTGSTTGSASGWQLNPSGTAAFSAGINTGVNVSGLDVLANRFIAASDARIKPNARLITSEEGERFVRDVPGRLYHKEDREGGLSWEAGFFAQDALNNGFPEMVVASDDPTMPAEKNGAVGPAGTLLEIVTGSPVAYLSAALAGVLDSIDALKERIGTLEQNGGAPR